MKKTFAIGITCLLVLSSVDLLFPTQALNEPNVSVQLNSLGTKPSMNLVMVGSYHIQSSSVLLKTNGTYQIRYENGKVSLYENSTRLLLQDTITLIPSTYSSDTMVKVDTVPYMGTLTFSPSGTNVKAMNTLRLEDYLKGVVPSEMSPSREKEALKAQAVAARTYVLKNGTNSIDDGQNHQVFKGRNWYTSTNQAVDETNGIVVKHNNAYASTFYSSTNGGQILSVTNSWGTTLTSYPYLASKADPYTIRSNNSYLNWSLSLDKKQIDTSSLSLSDPSQWWDQTAEKDTSVMTTFKSWLKRTPSSNPYVKSSYEIKIVNIKNISFTLPPFVSTDTLTGSVTIDYYVKDTSVTSGNPYLTNTDGTLKLHTLTVNQRSDNLRSAFGTSVLKSPYITEVAQDSTKFTIKGSGFGHGIGMSQYGAYQMAKEGMSYTQILNFYYPNTQMVDVISPSISNVSVTTNAINLISGRYTISEPSKVTLTLSNGSTTSTLLSNVNVSSGEQQFSYDAARFPGGTYTYTLTLKDSSENTSTYSGTIVLQTVFDLGFSNVNVNAKADGTSSFSYTINSDATISLDVYSYGSHVASLLKNQAVKKGDQTFTWDSRLATYGAYTYVLTAKDEFNRTTTKNGSFSLTPTPGTSELLYTVQPGDTWEAISRKFETPVPTLQQRNRWFTYNLYIGQPLIVINNKLDPVFSSLSADVNDNDYVSFSFTGNKPMKTTLRLATYGYDVATPVLNQSIETGESTVRWNTANASPGNYVATLYGIDTYGHDVTKTLTFTLPPQVKTGETLYTVQPGDTVNAIASRHQVTLDALQKRNNWYRYALFIGQPFVIPVGNPNPSIDGIQISVNSTDQVIFSYSLSKNSDTWLNLTSYGQSYPTAYNRTFQSSGTQKMNWNGQTAPYGLYTYTLKARDAYWKEVNKTGTFMFLPTLQYGEKLYYVQPGDTMAIIGLKHKVSATQLSARNRWYRYALYVGQPMVIPAPSSTQQANAVYYTVQPGDTLWKISSLYSVSVNQITQLNGLSTSALYIGQMLRIK